MKTFNTFLTEMAYQDLKKIKFKDNFDKAFGEYALNEVPLKWTKEEQEQCKKKYGDIDVGIVYHGNRISTEEQLTFIQSLSKGMTYPCDLISATPEKETAISFMEYVKSHDEYRMLLSLSSSLKRGSSGNFGSFLLTLKPTPTQVIASTFGPTKNKFTQTAETECILNGDVKIVDVKIMTPFTLDNWFNTLKTNFLEVVSSDFFNRWLDHHKIKITKDQAKELINLLKTEDDVLTFLRGCEKDNRIFYILSYSDIQQNKVLLNTILKFLKFNVNTPFLAINNEKIYLNNEELISELKIEHKKQIDINIKEKYNELKNNDNKIYFDENKGKLLITDDTYKLFNLIKLANERKIKLDVNKSLKQLTDIIIKLKDMSNEFINTKTLKDLSSLDVVSNIFKSLLTILEINDIINDDLSFIQKTWNWFYHSFAKGEITNPRLLSDYTKLLVSLLSNKTFLEGLTNIRDSK